MILPRQNIESINEELVARGLRAQLKTGNILTGMLYVDLEFFPDADKEEDTAW